MDLELWSDAALLRYQYLASKVCDSEVFAEITLSPAECRELECFRLGIAERRAPPLPPVERTQTIIEEPPSLPPIDARSTPHADEVPPCEYCGGRPCVGETHHSYRVLHYNDPEEAERRRLDLQQREAFTRSAWHALGITPPEY